MAGAWIMLELPILHSPSSVPLASSAVLSLSASVPLCALHAATLPVSHWMSRPLPVRFIKPVRMKWNPDASTLACIFSSHFTLQTAER